MESVYIATSGRAHTARPALERAGAYRVYADPAELMARADELGIRDLPLGG